METGGFDMASSGTSSLSIKAIGLFLAGLATGLLAGFLLFSPAIQPVPADQVVAAAPVPSVAASASPSPDASPASPGLPVPAFRAEKQLGTLPWENEPDYVAWMAAHSKEPEDSLRARYALAQRFIGTRELEGVAIEGFLRTPRENFVRQANLKRAYENTWLPIGWGATITDPAVVSMMTTTLDVKPEHRVLEIGTGSGYQSAILSNLSDYVFSIEIIKPLQAETDALYAKLSADYPQYNNIHRKLGDGYYGWEEYAPFDRIIVTCAIDHLPPPLLRQLAVGGIMVVPLGPPGRQHIMEVKKTVDEAGVEVLKRRDVYNGGGVKFIPFRDEKGGSYSGTRQ
jgi:protein-L-isoaspartate(D-aspartate) O-methyltransferase